jgi:PKD repeat protein
LALITIWEWDFNNDGTPDSTLQHPSYSYTAAGTYTVKLTATYLLTSDTETKTGYITVTSALVAGFSADRTAVVVGQTVTFTDNSTGGVGTLSYLWEFGDGQTSTAPNPTHAYSAFGTYTVKLTVTDSALNPDSEEKVGYIIVSNALVADFSADRVLAAVGQAIQFTDLSTGGAGALSYQWDFNNDGTPDSTLQHPSYSYTAAGTYTVKLTVTDTAANTNPATKANYITVAAGLQADFNADRVLVAVGQSIQFTDLSAGGVGTLIYQWDFNNDGTWDSTLQSPSYIYSSLGTYTVVLRVTDGVPVMDTETKTSYITVTSGLLADFSADKTKAVVGQSIIFTNLSANGSTPLSYQWDFNGDGKWDSTVQNPSYSYSTAGTYSVVLKVTDSKSKSDTETKTRYIVVYALPQAEFTVSAASVLPGQTITFTGSSAGGVPPLTYAWDFNGDGVVDSTNQQPMYAYAVAGVYTVSLKVSDSGGNSDTETKTNYITVGTIAIAPHAIPPQGGTIQTADGRMAATFPAEAYSGDATLTILEVSASAAPKAPEGYKIGTSCFTMEAKDARGKAVTSLSRPATITLKYSDEDLAAAGGDPGNLVLAYYNAATDKWTLTEAAFNGTNKTMSTTATQFNTWAILVKTDSGGLALWAKILIAMASAVAVGLVIWRAFSVKQPEPWPDD